MEEKIDIPSLFLCPISLQVMRDPVTVATGITYDREYIERWLFRCKNQTCPVTRQQLVVISDHIDLTPNHTLRRLIQGWYIQNAVLGIESIPTPKPPINKAQIVKLLDEANKSCPLAKINCLRKLRSIVEGNVSDRKCLEAAGAVEFLASVIKKHASDLAAQLEKFVNGAVVEALEILYHLEPSEKSFKVLLMSDDDHELEESLLAALECGNSQSRVYSITLLKSLYNATDPAQLCNIKAQVFVEIVKILSNKISKASKTALKLLVEICPWGRNRIKAIESNAVYVLIDLLLDKPERRVCELILMALDLLCRCAEGREELLKHGAGMAIVSKKILRISEGASERATRILYSISKYSATPRVVQEMLKVGVVSKLCLVLQVNSGPKTKERSMEILRLHSSAWKDSKCIPVRLLSPLLSS